MNRTTITYVYVHTHTQGGFAHCYELIDMDTNHVFAGKIVPKTMLTKPHQRDKMTMEIEIHRSLSHQHIVGFHGFFEVTVTCTPLCMAISTVYKHMCTFRLNTPQN